LPPAAAIGALVNQRALTMAEKPAFIDAHDAHTVTWRQVAVAARDLRARFALPSPVAELRVGLTVKAPVDFCLQYLASLAAGLPIAPLDPGSSDAELLWAAASYDLSHLIRDGGEVMELRRARPEAASPFIPVPAGRAAHPSAAVEWDATPAPTAALVTATRGSMGPPKLVPLSEGQLVLAAATTARHLGLRPSDVGYCPTPLHLIDTEVVGILAALLSGGSIAVGSFDRRSAWATVDDFGATWMNLAPAMVEALIGVRPPAAAVEQRLRVARVSGAGLPLAIHGRFWQATGIALLESYTLAEAAGPVAANPVELAGRRPGSVGLPVGVELRIVRDNGQVAPLGQAGRVQVRGATVVSSYLPYGSPGRDRAPLPAGDLDGWLETGDLGYRSPDGYVYLTGRKALSGFGHSDRAERSGHAGAGVAPSPTRRRRDEHGAAERSSQVACGTPASPLRAAAFRP